MQTYRTINSVCFLLFFGLLSTFTAGAQQESFSAQISKADKLPDTDSNKVYNYCDVAIKLGHNSEFEKAKEMVDKAAAILSKGKNPRMDALFYYTSGYINYSIQDYANSLSSLLKATKLFEQQNNKSKLAACNTIIGFIYQDQGIYDKADIFFKDVVDLRLEIKDSLNLSASYSNLGLNYYKIAQAKKSGGGEHFSIKDVYEFKEAFHYFDLALQIARQFNLPSSEATALGNLSNIMNDKKDFKGALEYAMQSLEAYRKIGDIYNETVSLIDIGSVYYMQNKPKEALQWHLKALEASKKNKFQELERYAYLNLRNTYEKMGDYKQAYINL
jgi:tetratricopeptide (TPR) repeat protein